MPFLRAMYWSFLVAALTVFSSVRAQTNLNWTQTYPSVHNGYAFVLSPLNNNVVYLHDNVEGAFKVSYDAGATWNTRGSIFPGPGIRTIRVSPLDTSIIVMVGNSGILRSTNGGYDWDIVQPDGSIDGESIDYNFAHPDTMYFADFYTSEFWLSADTGRTWQVRSVVPYGNICTIAADPFHPNVIVVGSGDTRIARSTDYGETWTLVKTGNEYFSECPKIVWDKFTPGVVYAAMQQDVNYSFFRSTDGGITWNDIGLYGMFMWGLDQDPVNGDLFIGIFGSTGSTQKEFDLGVFRSADKGKSWQQLGNIFTYPNVWMIKAATNHDVYILNADDINAFGNVNLYKLNTNPSGYGKVSGAITTAAGGLPVEHASVVVVGGSDSCIVNNTDGTYTMYLSPGAYSLKAQSAGVNQIIGSVTVSAGGTTTVDFQLPLSGMLGSIGVNVSNIYQDEVEYTALLYGRYGNGAPFPVDTLSGDAFTNLSSLNSYDSVVVIPTTVPYITTTLTPLALNNNYTVNLNRADIFIINDPDLAFGFGGATYAPTYQTPLSDSGITSFNWNVDERGLSISLEALSKTNLKTVMWLTRRHTSSMPQAFLDSLTMWCNEGINMIVAGQNLVEWDSAHSFFKNTLKLGFAGNYTNSPAINGFSISPIGSGINFSASSSTSRDKITILSPSGHKTFYYGTTAADSVNIGGAFVDDTGNNGWALFMGFDLSGVASSVLGKIFKRTLSLNAPAAPSNLTATGVSASKIRLDWTDNSDNESEFIILRSLASGIGYSNVAIAETNATTYTDSNLSANTKYYYVIKAVNASGTSPISNEASDTTFALPLSEQYAPHIGTSILQNPALSRYFNLVVVTDTALSKVPSVKMWITGSTDSSSVTMSLVSGTNKVYHGASMFSTIGTYHFLITATADGGRDSVQIRDFAVALAKPGYVTTVITPNGRATLIINKSSVNTETYVTASEENEAVVKFGPENDYREDLALTMTYADGDFPDEGKLFVYQRAGDVWVRLHSQVYAEENQVRALVKTLGEFKIVFDASFAGNNVVPEEFTLKQNYPNPFNPTTTIAFDLPQDGNLKLTVYNLLGQRVKTLYNGFQPAGSYRMNWDGKNELGQQVASGVYLYRIETGAFVKTKKMMLIK